MLYSETLFFSTCPHPARDATQLFPDATRHPIQLVFYLNQIKFDLSLTNSTLPDALDWTEFHGRTDTSCHPERVSLKTVWENDQSLALHVIPKDPMLHGDFLISYIGSHAWWRAVALAGV
jgi:hypothetical protein